MHFGTDATTLDRNRYDYKNKNKQKKKEKTNMRITDDP